MSSLFAQRFGDVARPVLEMRLGELVTIARGASSTTGVIAVRASHGEATQRSAPNGATVTYVIDGTWTVAKSLYLISGVAVEPRTGDRLTDASGQTWEVLPSIAGPAVLSHAGGLEWEIKTKMVVA